MKNRVSECVGRMMPLLIIREARSLHAISLPLAAVFAIETVMYLVDKIVVGRLGAEPLAALGLATRVTGDMMYSLCLCILGIGNILASNAIARENIRITHQVIGHSILLSIVLSAPVMLLSYNIGDALLAMGQSPNVSSLAGEYGRGAAWAVLPLVLFTVLRDFRAILSDLRGVVWLISIAALTKFALVTLLVFGGYGIPPLGMFGAGVASSLIAWGVLAAEIASQYIRPMNPSLRHALSAFTYDVKIVADYFRVGIPVVLNSLVLTSLWLTLNLLVGTYGGSALAGHQIVIGVVLLALIIPEGMREAVAIRAARFLGLQGSNSVWTIAMIGAVSNLIFVAPFLVMMLFFPLLLTRIFIDPDTLTNADAVEWARWIFAYAAAYLVIDSIQIPLIAALKGLRKTRAPLVIGFVCYIVLGIGSGYYISVQLNYGVLGLWFGVVVGNLLAVAILATRLALIVKGAQQSFLEPRPESS
ncbi:hypothetical protein LGR54_00385 [Ancylobacter sp. Lp-2]|uniref:MATE family efflux transporter n=1 Tax=Ancylobacter sp. Lp-2 TaxID=2881339 RepID=UPI001E4C0B20|nr:MATE family efflux transporter [Ancylobacter sp. Lp-2]MCB4767053.1 hypothetical protein [Ancylobacter sp. Lp-2]